MHKTERHQEIDFLRGISIFVMILIHTNAYFLENRFAFFTWDISEFAVPAFIFCSSYIFFRRGIPLTFPSFAGYIKKRFVRLVIPYYVFLFAYFGLTFLTKPAKLTPLFVLQNYTLIGGVDLNWLVLLFLTLTLFFPILFFFKEKLKPLWYLLLLGSLVSSIIFLFIKPAFNYKLIMWLPWLLIVFFSVYFPKIEAHKKLLALISGVSLISYLLLRWLFIIVHHPTSHYDNKYPPNFYHLIYGIFAISFLYALCRQGVFNFKYLKMLFHFLSRYSYSIFFVHFLVIFAVTAYTNVKPWGWYGFFAVVFAITILLQLVINILEERIKSRDKSHIKLGTKS